MMSKDLQRANDNPAALRRRLPLVALLLSLAAIVAVAGLIVGVAWFALSAMKSTDVYRMAWEKVRGDPQVIQALGEPLVEGWLASGEIRTENDRGTANISFGISGPKGSATVLVTGVRSESVWALASLKIQVLNQPEALVLVAPVATPEAERKNAPSSRTLNDTAWNAKLANIPSKSLSHASRELVLRGKSHDYIRSIFGEPTEIRTASFEELRYGQPAKLPYHDEQWIFRRPMGHLFVYFQNELVVYAAEEWSDF
jgi:hypothetical protein